MLKRLYTVPTIKVVKIKAHPILAGSSLQTYDVNADDYGAKSGVVLFNDEEPEETSVW